MRQSLLDMDWPNSKGGLYSIRVNRERDRRWDGLNFSIPANKTEDTSQRLYVLVFLTQHGLVSPPISIGCLLVAYWRSLRGSFQLKPQDRKVPLLLFYNKDEKTMSVVKAVRRSRERPSQKKDRMMRSYNCPWGSDKLTSTHRNLWARVPFQLCFVIHNLAGLNYSYGTHSFMVEVQTRSATQFSGSHLCI